MIAAVLAAAVGYGTADSDASPLGPWLVGGFPQEMSVAVPGALTKHSRLDAFDHDIIVQDDDLPWSSNSSAGSILYLQLVEAAVPHSKVAPSQAFLRHSQFAANAGTAAFKTFGYTATTNELDDEYYYPLAATPDGTHVLVVRAPGKVPVGCSTSACLYDHMNALEDLTDYVATRTLTAVGDGPTTKHTFFFVSGTGHLSTSSTSAALSLLGGALALGLVAAAVDLVVHHQKLAPAKDSKVKLDSELVAFTAVGLFSAVTTTLLSVYWDEAAGKEHSSIRVVDGENGVHRHLPGWTFVFVGLSAAAVVASLAALIFASSKHDKLPRKPNPRYNKWTRFLIITTTTISVGLACMLPTAYESALGSRAMALTNKTLVHGALDAASVILHASYETQADARKALDDDSYMSTVRLASWGCVALMLASAAMAAFFNHARLEHSPHRSHTALLVAAAALVAAVAAVTQVSLGEHFDISDHNMCTMPPEWGWYMAALIGAAVFYVSATGLIIAAQVRANAKLLVTMALLLIVAAGFAHALAAYSHLDSHCPRLIDHHWIGTFSSVSLAVLITVLVLFGFATPGQDSVASDEMELDPMTKPQEFASQSPPSYTPLRSRGTEVPTDGFFGL